MKNVKEPIKNVKEQTVVSTKTMSKFTYGTYIHT